MSKKFVVVGSRDSAKPYIKALVDNGFEETRQGQSDFMLIDGEHAGGRRGRIEEYLKERPVFIYPHTPLSYFIWDGHYDPLPVQCTFVAGEAAKKSLQAYDYPNRVESVGFGRCEIKEFTPTNGKKLLFVPARTRTNGQYANDAYTLETPKVWTFVLAHLDHFESVTVCYVNDFVNENDYAHSGIEFIKTFPRERPSPTDDMVEHIDKADIVLSCETVMCLAVARGKPTIAYNTKSVPATSNIPAANYEKYRKYYQYPLDYAYMTIDEIIRFCHSQNSTAELWKRYNIGGEFNGEKVVRVIQEFL